MEQGRTIYRERVVVLLLSVTIVLVAVLWSGLSLFARSDVVDGMVCRAATTVGRVLPSGLSGLGGIGPECVQYPVIDRAILRGHIEVSTGREVSVFRSWFLRTRSPERVVPRLIVLLLGGVIVALVVVRCGWPRPRAVSTGSDRLGFSRARFLKSWLWTTAAIGPVIALSEAAYWPIVSFWGTVEYEAVTITGVSAWVIDRVGTRILVAVGLLFVCLGLSARLGRIVLNSLLRRHGTPGVRAGAIGTCLECGYPRDPSIGAGVVCPECGSQNTGVIDEVGGRGGGPSVGSSSAIMCVWPQWRGGSGFSGWMFGLPTRRRRRAVLLGVVVVSLTLIASPLVIGVLRSVYFTLV